MAERNSGAISIVETNTLGEHDLLEIFDSLERLAIKWRTIGLKLGFSMAQLDAIDTNETNLDNKLMRMSSDWLQRKHNEDKYGPPTWERLANAVKTVSPYVAKEITRKHGDTVLPDYDDQRNSNNTSHREQAGETHRSTETNPFICCCFSPTQTDMGTSKTNFQRNGPLTLSSQSEKIKQIADPTKILRKNHSSYHGNLTSKQAAEKLQTMGGNCFLVSHSKKEKGYVLSVHHKKSPQNYFTEHFRLMVDNGQLWLDAPDNHIPFNCLEDLIVHYQQNPLNELIFYIGRICESESTEYQYVLSNPDVSNPIMSNTTQPNPTLSDQSLPNPTVSNPTLPLPAVSDQALPLPAVPNQALSLPAVSNQVLPLPAVSNKSLSLPAVSNPTLTSLAWHTTAV